MAERDWKSYNEGVVKRGELLLGFDFLDSWDEKLEKMNSGKRGKAVRLPGELREVPRSA